MSKNQVMAILAIIIAGTLAGCSSTNSNIIASSTTGLGVDVEWNPNSNIPSARLGFVRNEVAVVPTDKGTSEGGAENAADVLMEIFIKSPLSLWGDDTGVYQRMATGKTAVTQPGASMMFVKDNNGNIDPALAEALANISEAKTKDVNIKSEIVELSQSDEAIRAKLDKLLAKENLTYDEFIDDTNLSTSKLKKILNKIK